MPLFNYMKKKILMYLSWIFVIIMFFTIFIFSNMNSDDSNSKSKEIIKETAVFICNVVHVDITSNDIEVIVNKYNYPFRKLCHFSEYFILSLLLIFALSLSGIKLNKVLLITIIVCLISCLFDEFHQSFVDGRSSLFTDCIIDFCGSLLCCIIYYLFRKNKTIK